jgi:hypothetical protein
MARKEEAEAAATQAPGRAMPSVDTQHVWYEIHRGPPWKTMALVAVDDGPPPAALAQSFGELATEEKTRRILVVNASTQLSRGSAKAPETEVFWRSLAQGERSALTVIDDHVDYLQLSRFDRARAARLLVSAPHNLKELSSGPPAYDGVIFAIDSLLAYPGATQLARAVDLVVLCIRLGATSLDAARRVTGIIGAERIVGSIALRPGVKAVQAPGAET